MSNELVRVRASKRECLRRRCLGTESGKWKCLYGNCCT